MNLIGELRKEKEFWQQCCRNSTKVGERKGKVGERNILNFSNSVAEIPLPKLPARVLCPEQLQQCHCRNREKKKIFFGNCGNGIAENWMGKKKCCCQNLGRNLKKRVTFTIFL